MFSQKRLNAGTESRCETGLLQWRAQDGLDEKGNNGCTAAESDQCCAWEMTAMRRSLRKWRDPREQCNTPKRLQKTNLAHWLAAAMKAEMLSWDSLIRSSSFTLLFFLHLLIHHPAFLTSSVGGRLLCGTDMLWVLIMMLWKKANLDLWWWKNWTGQQSSSRLLKQCTFTVAIRKSVMNY